jgi:hypothetical protein
VLGGTGREGGRVFGKNIAENFKDDLKLYDKRSIV